MKIESRLDTIILYRPVGLFEYRLIQESGFSAFPPRLYWQPIFYPVLNIEYVGFVTEFEIPADYFARFEVHVVGGAICQELWVPSEELETFNKNLLRKIEVVGTFEGENFSPDMEMPQYLRAP